MTKKKIILIAILIVFLACLAIFAVEMWNFADGVKKDAAKKHNIINN
jgi:hypothetical protein